MVATDANGDNDDRSNQHSCHKYMLDVINEGPMGNGNRMRLSKCVESNVGELYPEPTGN